MPTFKVLVDPSVWLDITKDHQQCTTPGVLEELITQGEVSLIVPRLLIVESNRNKPRLVQDGQRSLSTVLKRARQVVDPVGKRERKRFDPCLLNEWSHVSPANLKRESHRTGLRQQP